MHGAAWSAHAHWLLGHDDAARSSCREAIELARSLDHPYSLAVALAYGAITHQMRGDRAELRGAVAELRELCDRYGFAYYREWALVLDGWCRGGTAGHRPGPARHRQPRSAGSFARMPYWLSLLADLLDRDRRPRRGARDPGRRRRRRAQARDDVWWLPEVLRMRAAHDERRTAAVARLRAAADLAAGARQRRAAAALRTRPRRSAAFARRSRPFPRDADGERPRERCANAPFLASGVRPTATRRRPS